MTTFMAAGGHQGLQLVAIAALWHSGRHRAAPSSVLRGDSCGVQAPRHLPVWRRDNNMQKPAPLTLQHGFLGCVGCFFSAVLRRVTVQRWYSGVTLPGFAITKAKTHAEEDAYESKTHAHDDACHCVDVQLC